MIYPRGDGSSPNNHQDIIPISDQCTTILGAPYTKVLKVATYVKKELAEHGDAEHIQFTSSINLSQIWNWKVGISCN